MTAPWVPDGRLVVDGKSLEYVCFGPDPQAAPTLVLLHEGLGCASLWKDFPDRLAQATGFGVFAYSRAGYGQSDATELPRPLDYMSREATEVLPQVLDAIGFQRGVLVGHSDGASIATIYAGSVSDRRVRGLVLMAPHFFTEEAGLVEIAKAKVLFEAGDLRDRLGKYHRDPDMAFRGWNEAWLHPGFKDWNITDSIDHLRVPVLALQGEADQYGTLAQLDELEARSYAPVEVHVLEACRHAPFVDQPDRVLALVKDFGTRLERIEAVVPEAV